LGTLDSPLELNWLPLGPASATSILTIFYSGNQCANLS
jgi:hypothetical protein